MVFKQREVNANVDIKKLSKEINLSETTTKILVNRGYDTTLKINKFLNPNVNDLRDPFLLNNMKEVVEKITSAIESKKRILIFGDYDVDGISATAILYKFFEKKGVNVNYFLPNRYEDGYGLTIETATKVIKEYNPQLIITVDCGISCAKEVDFLIKNGVDVIVTDHHEIPEILPNCLTINAKIPNQKYGFTELCGAGVAFKIVQAFNEDIFEYLPIAAIATVADIVSLTDENRAIVILGLKHFENIPKGIKLLIKELKINKINSQDIAFKIAPKLNAAGRMGDASIALQLFINKNQQELFNYLVKLTQMNLERQQKCALVYEEALSKLGSINSNKQKCIILQGNNWDSGLLGIVCARLVEEYNKPTFLFSNENGILKGSVRSINGINIHTVLSSCGSLLETFGGHSMAAGLSLSLKNYEKFKTEVNGYFNEHFTEKDFLCVKEYDLKLNTKDINLNFVKELQVLEPFGCDNHKPIFMLEWEKSCYKTMTNYPQHLNIMLNNNVSLIAFNASAYIQNLQYNKTKQALVDLQINSFLGKETVKCVVKNFVFKEYNTLSQDMINGFYVKQLFARKDKDVYATHFNYEEDIFERVKNCFNSSNYGTLVVCNSKQNLDKINKEFSNFNYNYAIGKVNQKDAVNTIVTCLNNFDNLYNYTNIIFLEPVITKEYIYNFKSKIFVPKNERIDLNNLGVSTNRNNFSSVYSALVQHEGIVKDTEYLFYQELKKVCPYLRDINFAQFVIDIQVFKELGIIEIEKDFNYSIKILPNNKMSLFGSKTYCKLESYLK